MLLFLFTLLLHNENKSGVIKEITLFDISSLVKALAIGT